MIFTLLALLSFWAAVILRDGTDAKPLAMLHTLTEKFGRFRERTTATIGALIPPHTDSANIDAANLRHPPASEHVQFLSLGHTARDAQVCKLPPTKARTDTGSRLVYRWIDENGQTHLSDKRPINQIASVVDMAGTRRDFRYSIQADGVSLPLDFQGKIAAGSKRIYDTWHFFLGEEKLRQSLITLRLIGGVDRYNAFRQRAWPNSKPSGGFYSPVKNEAYVMFDPKQTGQAIRTSFHEVSHLITASHLGHTPPWLTEGLAEYFETMEPEHQGATIHPNHRHIRLLQRSRLPALEHFLAIDREQWNDEMREQNYAVAWSLMYFLMQGSPGIYAVKEVVEQAHRHFCKPFSWTDALHKAYPGGLRQLESDWRAWLSQGDFTSQQT